MQPSPTRDDQFVTIVLGTRPEAIKLAPVARALSSNVNVRLLLTGQHSDMVDTLVEDLDLHPATNLRVMRPAQELNQLTSRLMTGLGADFVAHRPAAVIVQGDTTTAMCAALAGFNEGIPVAHVEAGLRTHDRGNPFPEEMNRRLVSQLATWHFAPTDGAAENLRAEGHPEDSILVTGNTVIDNLLWVRQHGLGSSQFSGRVSNRLLVTLHRRENQGDVMSKLCIALGQAARDLNLELVLPVHRSPKVRASIEPFLSGHPNVTLCEPLGYLDFIATLADATVVLTDSGGVQEEAPSLDVPTLIARTTTERPEAVDAGCARLVGTEPADVIDALTELFGDREVRGRMAGAPNPFGDGFAADRIATTLTRSLSGRVDLDSSDDVERNGP